jgi:hypothetical protein
MTKEKTDWDSIPSLEGLKVDWEYEPENALGKRARDRMSAKELHVLFSVKNIPIKVVSKKFDEKGYLVDISNAGGAILLDKSLVEGQLMKIGLYLGKQKIVERAVARNIVPTKTGKYRTGVEFVELSEDSEVYIGSLISARGYTDY